MLSDNDKLVSKHLKLTGISVDESGKIKVDDEAILSLISAAGDHVQGGEAPLWNGACSNAHCLLS